MSLRKVWEVAVLVIVVSIAAQMLLTVLTPLIPYVVIGACLVGIVGGIYHRKRRW